MQVIEANRGEVFHNKTMCDKDQIETTTIEGFAEKDRDGDTNMRENRRHLDESDDSELDSDDEEGSGMNSASAMASSVKKG